MAASDSDQIDLGIAGLIGAELSGPIHAMREIVQSFHDSGRVSRASITALSEAIEAADTIARQSQQVARLAEGRLRQSHERVSLDQLLESALNERQAWFHAHGIAVQRSIKPVEIIVDPGLLSSLVDAALAWSLQQNQRLVIMLGIKNWPENGLLVIKGSQTVHTQNTDVPDPNADSLKWQLLHQTAKAMGVTVTREVRASETLLSMEFARTVKQLEGLTAMEISANTGDSAFHTGTKPLAGLRILLISADLAVRAEVESACRSLGLRPDTVTNSTQAVRYTERDQPHMIIVDERVRDKVFNELMQDIRRLNPNFGFLEITEDANTLEISSWMSDSMTRVSRNVLRAHLPSILTLELAKAF